MNPAAAATSFGDAIGVSGAATPPSVRRAAWLLHGLPEVDRDWLLAQLDDAQRGAVTPALQELSALGLVARAGEPDGAPAAKDKGAAAGQLEARPDDAPRTRAVDDARSSTSELQSSPSRSQSQSQSMPAARTASPWPSLGRLASVARQEPETVVLAILRAQDPHRRRLLLWSLPAARRRRLQAALNGRTGSLPIGLEAALRRALSAAPANDEGRR